MDQIRDDLKPRFTAEQCAACQRAIRTAKDMQALYEAAEKCGVDCSVFRATTDRVGQYLAAAQHYFPDLSGVP